MSEKPPPKQSPYSPFPFGSNLSMSSNRTSTDAGNNGFPSTSVTTSPSSSFLSTLNSPFLKGRVRAKEAYGGPVMFGGSSTNRRSRLLSASPYTAAAISSRKPHQRPLFEDSASSRRGSSAANTPSPAPSPSPSSTTSNDNGLMSSTARLIFDTLEKMSTPVRDAQKLIPSVSLSSPPRGEKRRLIAEQLDWCHDSLKRRRPRLGQSDSSRGTDHLNGPPLRTVFSPLPPTPKPRSTATKSARLSASTKASSIAETSTSAASSNLSLSKAFTPKPDLQGLPSTMVQPNVPSLEKNYLAVGSGGGGKIRAKVCETTRGQKSETFDPTPAFIASHNAPLPLKSLPVISYNCDNSNKTKPGGIPPFSNSSKPPTRIESANFSELPKGTKMSFKFAEPSPVKANSDNDLEDHENGVAHFSFCRPEEVKASSLSFCKEKSPSPVLTRTTNISGHHHSKLPDITAQMTQDVLGQNNALPDVTASTGIKVATSLSTESVMSFLGRK